MSMPILLGTITNLILLIILIFINRRVIANNLKDIKKWAWIILVLIFMFGLFLRLSAPTQYIYFDEHYRLNCAKNILVYGDVEVCYYSGYETESCWAYPKPLGSVIIFSIAFSLFGFGSTIPVYVSIFFGAICILMSFILAYSIFRDERPALYTAALFAVYPLLVSLSAITEDYMIALFFGMFSLFCFSLYIKENSQKTLLLSLLSLTFAINTRIEFIVLVPTVMFMLISGGGIVKRLRDYRFRKALIFSTPFFLIYLERFLLQIQNIVLPSYPDRIIEHFSQETSEFMLFGLPSTHISTPFFLESIISGFYYPLIFNIIILVGIYLALRHRLSFPWIMGILSILLITTHILTAFMTIILLVFAVSILFFLVSSGLTNIQDSLCFIRGRISTIIILLLLLGSFATFSYMGGDYTENTVSHSYFKNWFNSEENKLKIITTDFIRKDLPENAYLVSYKYYLLSNTHFTKTIPLHTSLTGNVVEEIIGNGSEVFFYIGFYNKTLIDLFYNTPYNEFINRYDLEKFSEHPLGNMTHTLYHVKGINKSNKPEYKSLPYPPWAEHLFGFPAKIRYR